MYTDKYIIEISSNNHPSTHPSRRPDDDVEEVTVHYSGWLKENYPEGAMYDF